MNRGRENHRFGLGRDASTEAASEGECERVRVNWKKEMKKWEENET